MSTSSISLLTCGALGVGITWGALLAPRTPLRPVAIGALLAQTAAVVLVVVWIAGSKALIPTAVAATVIYLIRRIVHG